ncbi:hypothetical protein EJB05_29484, partial [Eragrostis curvula]
MGAPTFPCSRPRESPRPRPPTSCFSVLSDSFDACFTSPLARSHRTTETIWEGQGRKTNKRIILACQRATQNSPEVQEAAGCLGADCVPRYVEMKKLLELEFDDAFQMKPKSFGDIVQSGWLGSMEYRKLELLWAQSRMHGKRC